MTDQIELLLARQHDPKIEAAKIASTAIRDFLGADQQIEQVRLVFFQQRDARVFREYHEF